jgi:ferredoxin
MLHSIFSDPILGIGNKIHVKGTYSSGVATSGETWSTSVWFGFASLDDKAEICSTSCPIALIWYPESSKQQSDCRKLEGCSAFWAGVYISLLPGTCASCSVQFLRVLWCDWRETPSTCRQCCVASGFFKIHLISDVTRNFDIFAIGQWPAAAL